MKLEKTCANRFLGRCPECKEDYDVNKHPNNYDCRNYRELHYFYFDVEGTEELINETNNRTKT